MKQKSHHQQSQLSKSFLIFILVAVVLGAAPMSRAESGPVSLKSPQTGVVTGIKFGIPLGDVSDPSKVAVFHEGRRLEADVFQMGNWSTQPSNWALIAMPVPEQWGGKSVKLDIRTDAKPQAPSSSIILSRESNSVVTVSNGVFELKLGSQGIETISSDGKTFSPEIFSPGVLFTEGAELSRPKDVKIDVQWDGKLYKRLLWEGTVAGNKEHEFRVQWEMDVYAGSPVLRSRVRFSCLRPENAPKSKTRQIDIAGIAPFSAVYEGANNMYIGGATVQAVGPLWEKEEDKHWFRGGSIIQKKHGWKVAHKKGKRSLTGEGDCLGEWIAFKNKGGLDIMIQARGFQEEGPVDQGQVSTLSVQQDRAQLLHWTGGTTQFYENFARGFDVDIVVGQPILKTMDYGYGLNPKSFQSVASDIINIKQYPYVVYDRDYMTKQGVLTESGVSHLVDEELKAVTDNVDLIMVNRNTTGVRWRFDSGGEDIATPMYYHWTWKFWVDWNDLDSSGFINKALMENYIRFGDDAKAAYFALDQARVWSENGYDLATGGVRHYRSKAPHAYSVMNEHLMAYKLTGEPFMLAGAKKIASINRSNFEQHMCPRYNKQTWYASDINWDYHQGRAAHPAIDMWRYYEFVGDIENRDFSARVYGENMYSMQEPEGWLITPKAKISKEDFEKSREWRCSPIYTGYSFTGMAPVFWRLPEGDTKELYKKVLLKFSDWYCDVVEDAQGGSPGMVGNSIWYGTIGTPKTETQWKQSSQRQKNPITWMPGKPIEQSVTTLKNAFPVLSMYQLTKDHKYFYTANASYFGALGMQHSSGSFPIDYAAPSNCSGWAGLYLPELYVLAERDQLPIAIKARRPDRKGAYNDQFFMGKGATWDGTTFSFAIQHRRFRIPPHEAGRSLERFPIPNPAGPECNDPIPLTVYFPSGKPASFKINGNDVDFTYDNNTKIVTMMLPAVKETTVYNIGIK